MRSLRLRAAMCVRPARVIRPTTPISSSSQQAGSCCCDRAAGAEASSALRDAIRWPPRLLAITEARPDDPMEYRARMFVLASGQCWSPHLLLLSANSRFPNGIANRSGTVGRYMAGHKFISAQALIDRRDVSRANHGAQFDLARVLSLLTNKQIWFVTIRACGRAPPARNRACDRPRDGCCLAMSCSMIGARAFEGQFGASPRVRFASSADSRLTLDHIKESLHGDPMPFERSIANSMRPRRPAKVPRWRTAQVFERMVKATTAG